MTHYNQSPAQRAARKKQSENWRKMQRNYSKQQLFEEPNLDKQPNVVREIVQESYLDEDDQMIVEEMRSKISSD